VKISLRVGSRFELGFPGQRHKVTPILPVRQIMVWSILLSLAELTGPAGLDLTHMGSRGQRSGRLLGAILNRRQTACLLTHVIVIGIMRRGTVFHPQCRHRSICVRPQTTKKALKLNDWVLVHSMPAFTCERVERLREGHEEDCRASATVFPLKEKWARGSLVDRVQKESVRMARRKGF
jgi:hypothetical protein